jgi:beta,beta-carotene 9',10'-dioxygenase
MNASEIHQSLPFPAASTALLRAVAAPAPEATRATKARSIEQLAPFRRPPEDFSDREATLRGSIPAWLEGDLVRTCPAVFERGQWKAQHWFDGLCMLYAFRVAPGGAVRFRRRLLESEVEKETRAGRLGRASFGTPNGRSFLQRVAEPVPRVTDNANVNVVALGGERVALTEGPHQPIFDPDTLAVRGHVASRTRTSTSSAAWW